MFFFGLYADATGSGATCAIIEKTLRYARNHYCVTGLLEIRPPVCDAVRALYADPRYTVRKRVFSQDRRPKKDVDARPKVVFCCNDGIQADVEALRENRIPVEKITPADCDRPRTEESDTIGEGHNHFVPPGELEKCFFSLIAEKRLVLDPGRQGEETLWRKLDRIVSNPAQPQSTSQDKTIESVLLAVSAPLWFRENIRYSRVYRAGFRNPRQFI